MYRVLFPFLCAFACGSVLSRRFGIRHPDGTTYPATVVFKKSSIHIKPTITLYGETCVIQYEVIDGISSCDHRQPVLKTDPTGTVTYGFNIMLKQGGMFTILSDSDKTENVINLHKERIVSVA
jgi:hypothetical protein